MRGIPRQLACALVCATVLVACGLADPPDSALSAMTPAQILKKARAAAVDASSVRIRGESTDKGKHWFFDVRFRAGVGMSGVLAKGSMDFEVLRIRRSVYLRADKDTWMMLGKGHRNAKEVADRVAGKYVKVSPSERSLTEFVEMTELSWFMRKLFGRLPSSDVGLTKTGIRAVDGVWAIGLTDADGATLDLSAVGPTYPIRLMPGPSDERPGRVDFLEWNAPVKLTRPPANQVIDLTDRALG